MKQVKAVEINGSSIEMFIRPDKRYQTVYHAKGILIESKPCDTAQEASEDFDTFLENIQ